MKQCINKHWTVMNHGTFEEPELDDEEKSAVRQGLLSALWHAPTAVRTAIGVCIAAIAKHDFPEQWPDVLNSMLAVIKSEDRSLEVRFHLRGVVIILQNVSYSYHPTSFRYVATGCSMICVWFGGQNIVLMTRQRHNHFQESRLYNKLKRSQQAPVHLGYVTHHGRLSSGVY